MNEKGNVPGIYYTELLYFDCLPRYGNQLQYRYAVNPALMYGKLSTIEELISIDNKSAVVINLCIPFLFFILRIVMVVKTIQLGLVVS